MSGATSNASISSLISQNQFMEEITSQSLIKSFRAATGQFKVLSNTNSVNSTLATESDFSFPVKGGRNYIMTANLLFRVGGAAGPVGGLQIEFLLPGHSGTNYALQGQLIYTVTAANPTIIALGNASGQPIAGAVQGMNAALSIDSTTTANIFGTVTVEALFTPTVDDLLSLQFAQVATSAGNATVLQKGSSMNLLCLASSRRAPNVV